MRVPRWKNYLQNVAMTSAGLGEIKRPTRSSRALMFDSGLLITPSQQVSSV